MFNNKFQEKIYKACIIIAIFSLFLAITYQFVFNALHVFVEKYDDKLEDVIHGVELEIASANQFMYTLSVVLSSEKIEKNNPRIDDLLDKYRAGHIYKIAPFYSMRIWGINDEVIYNNTQRKSVVSAASINKYFKDINKDSLNLEIGEIHLGERSKKELLPLSIAIIDRSDQKYKGMMRFSILTEDITNPFFNSLYYNIKLINQSNIERSKHRDQISKIDILKSYFKKEPLILVKPLVHYPIAVQLEVNSTYLGKEIILMILYCFGYFCVFAALAYMLLISYKKKYQKPFYDINQKALDCMFNYIEIILKTLLEIK